MTTIIYDGFKEKAMLIRHIERSHDVSQTFVKENTLYGIQTSREDHSVKSVAFNLFCPDYGTEPWFYTQA